MCDAKEFEAATAGGGLYYSPTFKDDKFIHATADPQFLLEAGNHFYKVVMLQYNIGYGRSQVHRNIDDFTTILPISAVCTLYFLLRKTP